MVDGSMNFSMSPETNRSDGGNLRRFSMGKASSLSIDEQNSSRDRRSSTGSCHDFCKYGHKHSLETKARVPLPKRAMKKPLDAQILEQAVVVPEKEKHSVHVTKSKASPSSGTCITGGTDVVKRVVPINSSSKRSPVVKEVMSESKDRVVLVKSPSRQSPVEIEVTSESNEPVVPVNSPSRQISVEMEVSRESKERVVPENSPSRQSLVENEVASESMERVVPENFPSRQGQVEIGVRSESKELVVPESSPRGKTSYRRSPLKSEVMNESKELVAKKKTMPVTPKPKIHKTKTQVVYSSTKSESSSKQALTSIGEAGGDSLSKLKASKAKSVTSSGPSGNIAVHRNNSSQSGEGAGTSKGNGTKVVGNSMVTSDLNSADPVVNLPAIKNKKVVSRVISQNKTRRVQTKEASGVEPQEKTLHIINIETKKTKLVESDQNEKHGFKGYPKSPSSPYKPSSLANGPSLSPFREDRGGTKYTKSDANAKFLGPRKHGGIKKEDDHSGVQKGGIKKDHHNEVKKGRSPRMLQTKGKDSSSFNLSYRNRKVVELHSKSHGPTRLKFMQGKSLGDNQNSKDGQRTSLKKGMVKGISKNSTPPSEKVVLRHQDVQGKKDTQVLFNNVIAETARNLVRTRKSKVKALVGAFEKVISLQDKKPPLRATG